VYRLVNLNDLGSVRFSRSMIGGYKASEVDKFLDELQEGCKKFFTERDGMVEEIAKLNRRIERFRQEEDLIKKAILNSEQIAQASMIDAGVKSKYILKDASEKAAKMVRHAREESEKEIKIAKKIHDNVENFKNEYLKKLNQQIDFIRSFKNISIKNFDDESFPSDNIVNKFGSIVDDISVEIFSGGAKQNDENVRTKFLSEMATSDKKEEISEKYKDLKFGPNIVT